MALVLVWVTFPGGGVYPWVWVPAGCATAFLLLAVRPRIAVDESVRAVDCTLMLAGVAIALQLVPLPTSMLRAIDPGAVTLRTALWLPSPASDPAIARLPISIAPRDTAAALGIFATAVILFWICRRICEGEGVGWLARTVAFIGLAASLAAIIQRAESRELLYGLWRPVDAGARPYGPFVNRNHFATWVIMACPLVFGYLLARAPRVRRSQHLSQRFVGALKQLGSVRVWLAASACLMTAAVLISTSRSGLIGLMGAFGASIVLSGRRRGPAGYRWTVLQVVLLALVALSFANLESLAERFDEILARVESSRGRGAIWADAERLIRDFPWVGTGAGTFGTAIIVYQTAEPGYSIGQAHNHYLQLAAEGGALVGVPAALALGALLALCRRRLEEDTTSNALIRVGAIAGLIGVLVQSFWETGLRMPANAMLFAVLAAIATYETPALPPAHRAH